MNIPPMERVPAAAQQPTELERRLADSLGGLELELGKLSPAPGDVVVIRVPPAAPDETVRAVAEYVSTVLAPTGARWLGLFEGMELEHVTAEEMARLGWVRAEVDQTADEAPTA